MKNPPWNIDELIVTLDFYFQYAPNIPQVDSSEIKELSDFLKKLASKTNTYKTGTFRNVNGVSMKLMNFRRFDPSYSGVGLKRGAKSDEDVWNKYSNKRDKLKKISRKIKLFVESDIVFDSESEIEVEGQEGKILTKVHKYRERDKKLVRSKKNEFLKKYGYLFCEVCKFNFQEKYGERGKDFIECHHNLHLSELSPDTKTKLSDLSLVCSNCHRMIHTRKPWLTLSELEKIILKNK